MTDIKDRLKSLEEIFSTARWRISSLESFEEKCETLNTERHDLVTKLSKLEEQNHVLAQQLRCYQEAFPNKSICPDCNGYGEVEVGVECDDYGNCGPVLGGCETCKTTGLVDVNPEKEASND